MNILLYILNKQGSGRGLKFWLAVSGAILASCGHDYVPRPRGYPRIDLPPLVYQKFMANFPYTFEFSASAIQKPDSSRHTEPFWLDIRYPAFDAEVQLTYKPLAGNMKLLNELTEDSRKLISKHQIKASGIEEQTIKTRAGNTAFVFTLSGQVPSQFQFYTTDSNAHFLRGALYFKTSTQNDSLKPVIDFISADMVHLLRTLEWKKLKK